MGEWIPGRASLARDDKSGFSAACAPAERVSFATLDPGHSPRMTRNEKEKWRGIAAPAIWSFWMNLAS